MELKHASMTLSSLVRWALNATCSILIVFPSRWQHPCSRLSPTNPRSLYHRVQGILIKVPNGMLEASKSNKTSFKFKCLLRLEGLGQVCQYKTSLRVQWARVVKGLCGSTPNHTNIVPLTLDNSNPQGKSKKVWVIRSSKIIARRKEITVFTA